MHALSFSFQFVSYRRNFDWITWRPKSTFGGQILSDTSNCKYSWSRIYQTWDASNSLEIPFNFPCKCMELVHMYSGPPHSKTSDISNTVLCQSPESAFFLKTTVEPQLYDFEGAPKTIVNWKSMNIGSDSQSCLQKKSDMKVHCFKESRLNYFKRWQLSI